MERNFIYKVEKRTRDRMKVVCLLYAGNNLAKGPEIFARGVKHRPRIGLTIRQGARLLQQWCHRRPPEFVGASWIWGLVFQRYAA
jgi:hypothetical protein